MQVIYVAGPYSAPTEDGVEANIDRAREAGRRLLDLGYAVIIPHTMTGHMEGPHDLFLQADLEIIRRLQPGDGLYMLRGWQYSRGARREWRLAHEIGLRIWHQGRDEPPGPEWVTNGTMEVAYA
jgi:hypothetical protein